MADVDSTSGGETMNELEVQVEILSEHVTRLEGVIDVMLQEAENGTLQDSAPSIRAALSGDGE
jgi:hypothetical protein